MPNRVCFASIDVEHPIDNLSQILEVFKRNNIPATLFVTGKVLEQHPGLFKNLPSNYEVACHSFTHRFWNTLDSEERKKELSDFLFLYQNIFNKKPRGFRAPSHIIDEEALELLEEKGFLYDSSIVPHYPPFKKYRGYKGKRPLLPYSPNGRKILEIPVRGQIFGVPLAGAWITKLPYLIYRILFIFYRPKFITLSIHSWDKLKNLERIIRLLKNKNYQFLNGSEIYQNYK
ncbi:MAG: polysaccharide deacetylase family protein [Candidatus Nealsonbacteria bacterium]|nr:polysaccharide deacetylase family protein [Candidatus Nealsonbacteria bacterium]